MNPLHIMTQGIVKNSRAGEQAEHPFQQPPQSPFEHEQCSSPCPQSQTIGTDQS